jgi:hypothetical protein
MPRCGACRYDSYDFFASMLKAGMNDEKYGARCDRSQRDPAFFLVRCFVALRQGAGVIEYQDRGFETDFVLRQVPLILRIVPFKAHGDANLASSILKDRMRYVNTVVHTTHTSAGSISAACSMRRR